MEPRLWLEICSRTDIWFWHYVCHLFSAAFVKFEFFFLFPVLCLFAMAFFSVQQSAQLFKFKDEMAVPVGKREFRNISTLCREPHSFRRGPFAMKFRMHIMTFLFQFSYHCNGGLSSFNSLQEFKNVMLTFLHAALINAGILIKLTPVNLNWPSQLKVAWILYDTVLIVRVVKFIIQ